jgi:ADP-ribosylglycohydrolase
MPPTSSADLERGRFRGALLGLAAGDAVGMTLEFERAKFEPITDMVGGGPFGLAPGEWTDDTSMALCLAESRKYLENYPATSVATSARGTDRVAVYRELIEAADSRPVRSPTRKHPRRSGCTST